MYVCTQCGEQFADHEVATELVAPDMVGEPEEYAEVCPYCGSTDIHSFIEEIDRF